MAFLAGLGRVVHLLADIHGQWLIASAAGVLIAFSGYRFAFDGVIWNGAKQSLTRRQRLGVIAAGFGAFVHRGGTAIDRYAMRTTGLGRRESDVRLVALQGFEMVPVSVAACLAAFVALFVGGSGRPPIDFDLPWAIGPLVGAPVVLFLAYRYRDRWRAASGWRYWLGVVADGVSTMVTFLGDRRNWVAVAGITVFSAGELLAIWAAMATFGYRVPWPTLVLGYGVAYVISRRAAPLGGAGAIDVLLIVALHQAGVPLPVAVAGTCTYRFFNLWCAMPVSLLALPGIRRLSDPPATAR